MPLALLGWYSFFLQNILAIMQTQKCNFFQHTETPLKDSVKFCYYSSSQTHKHDRTIQILILIPAKALVTLNLQVALFRDLLLDVGGCKDGPALREKVRRVRMGAVEAVVRTYRTILPHIKE